MASLNESALRRLANFCVACGIFRKKVTEDKDEIYGEKVDEVTKPAVEVLELGSVEVDNVGAVGVAAADDVIVSSGGGDSPRVDIGEDKDEKDTTSIVIDDHKILKKEKSKFSLRRLFGRASAKKGKKIRDQEVENEAEIVQDKDEGEDGFHLKFGQMLLDLTMEEFLKVKVKSKKAEAKNEVKIVQDKADVEDGIHLEFGQMLLDLSKEEFLKVKSQKWLNVPLIVVSPPTEDALF